MDIQQIIDDAHHLCGYLAKGQHSNAQMVVQIKHQWDETFEMSKYCSIEAGYFRWIPEPPTSCMPYDHRLEPSKPGRGAFVATVIYLI